MKACIETFGCQMNVHDSERATGLLKRAGYEITSDASDADLVLVNTCSIRERAEAKLFSRLGVLRGFSSSKERLVVLAGCVAQQEGSAILDKTDGVDVVVGTQALKQLPALIEAARITGLPQVDVNPYEDISFPLGVAARSDTLKAYINIIEGCNDHCAFCVVPHTRGHERMRKASEILSEVKEAVSTGRKEICLLGQIVNNYSAPDLPNCDFPKLLELIHEIPKVYRIRFTSPHPRHVSLRMISAMRDLPNICKHLHLPVQSGSTRVLESMRRRYTREDYLVLVEKIRKEIPNIALSTDVIVGFPGESLADFQETLSLTETVGFHWMYSFKYSERPKTLAKKRMPDTVSESEKGRRLIELQSLQSDIQLSINKSSINKTFEVLVDSRSKKKPDEFSGRTTHNTVVNFPGKIKWIGKPVNVEILKAGPHSLWGEVRCAD